MRTALPARITTLHGHYPVVLHDLSLAGAMIEVQASAPLAGPAPAEAIALVSGQDVVLSWEAGEAFGEVVWRCGLRAGLHFEQDLPAAVLIATRRLHDALSRQGGLEHLLRERVRHFVEGRVRRF